MAARLSEAERMHRHNEEMRLALRRICLLPMRATDCSRIA
jgi:hypothetical protein